MATKTQNNNIDTQNNFDTQKNNFGIQLAVIATDISYIKSDVTDIKRQIESNYVSKTEFDPIKRLVYGLVTLILVAVVGAVVSLVMKK